MYCFIGGIRKIIEDQIKPAYSIFGSISVPIIKLDEKYEELTLGYFNGGSKVNTIGNCRLEIVINTKFDVADFLQKTEGRDRYDIVRGYYSRKGIESCFIGDNFLGVFTQADLYQDDKFVKRYRFLRENYESFKFFGAVCDGGGHYLCFI